MRDYSREVELDLQVAARRMVAVGVVQLELRDPSGAELPSWEPGAHVDLVLGPGLERQYSLCGDPGDTSSWHVSVLLEPESRGGSIQVHTGLPLGSTVRVRGPRNHFRLEPSPCYQFVAGGIGITPILPMLRQVEREGRDWTLLYGGRTDASMAFANDLRAEFGEKVRLLPENEHGLLPLDEVLADPRDGTLVYCCGPEPLLGAVEQSCHRWPPGSLHVERFAPKVIEAADSAAQFVVECKRSGVEVVVTPGVSVLDALIDARIDVESSCTEGVCGTCETRVLEGVPDHLDSVMTPEEQAANDTMFVCVSRSLTPRLVIDR